MNQRIKEFAEQCKEKVASTEWPGEWWEHFDEEKFAELIVQECALVIQDFVDYRIPASEYPKLLLKELGVEK